MQKYKKMLEKDDTFIFLFAVNGKMIIFAVGFCIKISIFYIFL